MKKFKLKIELEMKSLQDFPSKELKDVKNQLVAHLPILKDYYVNILGKTFTISCKDVKRVEKI